MVSTALRGAVRLRMKLRTSPAARASVRAIDDALMIAGCLAALGSPGHEKALTALRDMAERAI